MSSTYLGPAALAVILLTTVVETVSSQVPQGSAPDQVSSAFAAALSLETNSQWDSAAVVLRRNWESLSEAEREHAARLETLTAALRAADIYERAGRPDTAVAVLQQLELD